MVCMPVNAKHFFGVFIYFGHDCLSVQYILHLIFHEGKIGGRVVGLTL